MPSQTELRLAYLENSLLIVRVVKNLSDVGVGSLPALKMFFGLLNCSKKNEVASSNTSTTNVNETQITNTWTRTSAPTASTAPTSNTPRNDVHLTAAAAA